MSNTIIKSIELSNDMFGIVQTLSRNVRLLADRFDYYFDVCGYDFYFNSINIDHPGIDILVRLLFERDGQEIWVRMGNSFRLDSFKCENMILVTYTQRMPVMSRDGNFPIVGLNDGVTTETERVVRTILHLRSTQVFQSQEFLNAFEDPDKFIEGFATFQKISAKYSGKPIFIGRRLGIKK